ncbi:hypothetical protein, partial [Escherichia coli]|uniref:hypothetical protein n=1 Tax=Escherichia coli TaxID=562 RepID=UPI003754D3F6
KNYFTTVFSIFRKISGIQTLVVSQITMKWIVNWPADNAFIYMCVSIFTYVMFAHLNLEERNP